MDEVRKQEFFLLQLYGSLVTVFPGDGVEFGASVPGWYCPWKGRPELTGAVVALALKMKRMKSNGLLWGHSSSLSSSLPSIGPVAKGKG